MKVTDIKKENPLIERIKKVSLIKETRVLTESPYFENREQIPTKVYGINIACSGTLRGGFSSGITMWAGPSKHFKTLFGLIQVKAYMEKYPNSVVLFYDTEFGAPKEYFETLSIDMTRVIHTPILDIEEIKQDVMAQLNNIQKGDKIIIFVDSIGMMASRKEVEDALDQKSVSDMTRAKQLKSLFRMVTPHLIIKDIPMVIINHTYKTLELYAKDVVGGGTGSYLASNNIFIIGREQITEKIDGKQVVTGFTYSIKIEKSRFAKERSKIPINVTFEDGISVFSGLLDLAEEGGFIIKSGKPSKYQKINTVSGEVDEKGYLLDETNTNEFWNSIIDDPKFVKFIEDKYKLGGTSNIMATSDE